MAKILTKAQPRYTPNVRMWLNRLCETAYNIGLRVDEQVSEGKIPDPATMKAFKDVFDCLAKVREQQITLKKVNVASNLGTEFDKLQGDALVKTIKRSLAVVRKQLGEAIDAETTDSE